MTIGQIAWGHKGGKTIGGPLDRPRGEQCRRPQHNIGGPDRQPWRMPTSSQYPRWGQQRMTPPVKPLCFEESGHKVSIRAALQWWQHQWWQWQQVRQAAAARASQQELWCAWLPGADAPTGEFAAAATAAATKADAGCSDSALMLDFADTDLDTVLTPTLE